MTSKNVKVTLQFPIEVWEQFRELGSSAYFQRGSFVKTLTLLGLECRKRQVLELKRLEIETKTIERQFLEAQTSLNSTKTRHVQTLELEQNKGE